MKAISPGSVTLDAHEQYRVIRAKMAERLHKLPAEIDSISYPDLCDLLEVIRADEAIDRWRDAQQATTRKAKALRH
jgi:hypothetical protein